MKYYLVYLLKGKVVSISSFDDGPSRVKQELDATLALEGSPTCSSLFSFTFDEVQSHNEIV